jgi:hypothetical protein
VDPYLQVLALNKLLPLLTFLIQLYSNPYHLAVVN